MLSISFERLEDFMRLDEELCHLHLKDVRTQLALFSLTHSSHLSKPIFYTSFYLRYLPRPPQAHKKT